MITQETQWATRRNMSLLDLAALLERIGWVNSDDMPEPGPYGGVRCVARSAKLASIQVDDHEAGVYSCRLWWHAHPRPQFGRAPSFDFGDLMTPDASPSERVQFV